MRLGGYQTRYAPISSDCGTSKVRERLGGVPGDVMQAARKLYEENGVHATTITAIASEAQVTRELVYYYFENKDAITAAVLDDYVEDLVESVVVWNELREFGNTPAELQKCISTFRRALYDTHCPRPMIGVLEELGVRDEFQVRAVRETVDCINSEVVAEYALYHQIEIDLVYEMFCVAIFGLVGLVKINPLISDEALMKVVAQTLRLDMRVLDKPSEEA